MSTALDNALGRALAPWAARLVSAIPRPWRATARRRRFLCLVSCAPGFAAVAALPLHRNLWGLLGGTFAVVVASVLRALSEPLLADGDLDD